MTRADERRTARIDAAFIELDALRAELAEATAAAESERIIAERDNEDGGWLVMLPTGEVVRVENVKAARSLIARHTKRTVRGILVTNVEWRT